MLFEKISHGGHPYAAGPLRRGRTIPELQDPGGRKIYLEFKELRVIAPELLTDLVGQPGTLLFEILGPARAIAKLNNGVIEWVGPPQTRWIRTNGAGQYTSVAAVILSARRGKTIPEAIQLLWIDGKDLKSAIMQAIDDRAVRNLDGDRNKACRNRHAAEDPVNELAKPIARVREGPFTEDRAVRCENTGLMGRRAPVNAHEKVRLRMSSHGMCASG